jgi:hypothetical protein
LLSCLEKKLTIVWLFLAFFQGMTAKIMSPKISPFEETRVYYKVLTVFVSSELIYCSGISCISRHFGQHHNNTNEQISNQSVFLGCMETALNPEIIGKLVKG